MPELQHAGAHLRLVGGQLTGAQGVFGGARRADRVDGLRQRLDVIARRQQLRYLTFRIKNAFALHFRRMSREHRRHKAFSQHVCYRFRGYASPAQAG